jgi:hypothetical protein
MSGKINATAFLPVVQSIYTSQYSPSAQDFRPETSPEADMPGSLLTRLIPTLTAALV